MTDHRAGRLIAAMAQYKALGADHYDEVLHEVSGRIAETGSVGKLDIAALIAWKRINAGTRWVMGLMSLSEAEVRRQTAAAVTLANEPGDVAKAADLARRALQNLPGCGPVSGAMPSVILTAAAPERFAIYDRRAHTGMNRLEILLGNKNLQLYGKYMEQVEVLRTELAQRGEHWTAREVDLALYQLGSHTNPVGEP